MGSNSVWMEEHHGVKNHYWPAPLVILASFASRTSRLMLGTNIAVLPFYNPVRLAEDAALVDGLSGGRLVLGAAIGYKPDEFEMMAAPMQERGSRFAEAIALIRRLWTEDSVTFSGQFYNYHQIRLEPKPVSRPSPPIWLGGWGPLALERAAELGDAWIPGPTANLAKLLECQALYRGHLARLGKSDRQVEIPLTREMVIAESEAEAWEMARTHLMINYRDEYAGGWKHPLIGKESPDRISQIEALGQDRFIIGDPAACIRQICRYQETFGVSHLIFRLYFPGLSHDFILRELELIGKEIIPVFRRPEPPLKESEVGPA